MLFHSARASLLALFLAGLFARTGAAQLPPTSPTLLADLSTVVSDEVVNGESRIVGRALGLLFVSGTREDQATNVWTVAGPGADPQPLHLPPSPDDSEDDLLYQVVDLGNGRAVLAYGSSSSPQSARLYGTDGTSAGTQPLGATLSEPNAPFFGNQVVGDLVLVQGWAYGIGRLGASSEGVLRTDGTPGGTSCIVSVSGAADLYQLGSRWIFKSGDSDSTRLLAAPLAGGAVTVLSENDDASPSLEALPVAGGLLFQWRASADAIFDFEPWFTDGTPSGTARLADASPGYSGSRPVGIDSDGVTAYFSAATLGFSSMGRELWSSDGTPAGTRRVIDLWPGPGNGVAATARGAIIGGDLYFSANDGTTGVELYRCDGTAAGTGLFQDLRPGPESSFPGEYGVFQSRLVVTADTGAGRVPFSTDGTGLLTLAAPGQPDTPGDATEFAGRVWIAGTSVTAGRELWSFDASVPLSTRLEVEVGTGPGTASSNPSGLVRAIDRGYFLTTHGSSAAAPATRSLFVTDGTAAGTQLVLSDPTGALEIEGTLDARVLLTIGDPLAGPEPWISDGTAAGSFPLGNFSPGAGSTDVSAAVQLGDLLYFLADTSLSGRELWSTDGTPAGTGLVVELLPGPVGLGPGTRLVRAADALFLLEETGDLWVSDGTPAGTVPAPGVPALADVRELLPSMDRLLLAASLLPGSASRAIWSTDGTAAGTVQEYVSPVPLTAIGRAGDRVVFRAQAQLLALQPDGSLVDLGVATSSTESPLAAGGGLYYEVGGFDGAPLALAYTDGTASGTVQLGPSPGVLTPLASGTEVLYTRTDPATGTELGLLNADGTTDVLVADFAPGPAVGAPVPLGRVGSSLLVSAFTLDVGREPHAVNVAAIGGFAAEPYGQGCAIGGLGDLRLAGEARFGEVVVLEASDLTPGSPAVFYASALPEVSALGGCTVYLDGPLGIGSGVVDVGGRAELTAPISNPAFVGVSLHLQVAALTPGGPALGSFELTNGLEVLIGE